MILWEQVRSWSTVREASSKRIPLGLIDRNKNTPPMCTVTNRKTETRFILIQDKNSRRAILALTLTRYWASFLIEWILIKQLFWLWRYIEVLAIILSLWLLCYLLFWTIFFFNTIRTVYSIYLAKCPLKTFRDIKSQDNIIALDIAPSPLHTFFSICQENLVLNIIKVRMAVCLTCIIVDAPLDGQTLRLFRVREEFICDTAKITLPLPSC